MHQNMWYYYNKNHFGKAVNLLAPTIYLIWPNYHTYSYKRTVKQFRSLKITAHVLVVLGVVGWCEGAVYLTSPGRPTDIGLQLGKACYPCSG